MTPNPIPDEKLLFADYDHFRSLFVQNEEVGEKRVNFFITLTTAVLAGVITLITADLPSQWSYTRLDTMVAVVLTGNLLFGLITLARIHKRNLVTDEYKRIQNYLRWQLRSRSVALDDYEIPFGSHSSLWFSGGLTELVSVMNSLIVALFVATQLPPPLSWWGALLALLLCFLLQKWVTDRGRSRVAQSSSQHFRAGTGAVILNPDLDRVLLFKRAGSVDDWQFPQGGLDVGEAPLDGVLREIWEETGITADDLELLPIEPKLLAYEIPAKHRRAKTGRGQTQLWHFFQFVGDQSTITLGDQEEFSDWQWTTMDDAVARAVEFKRAVYEGLGEAFTTWLA